MWSIIMGIAIRDYYSVTEIHYFVDDEDGIQ